MENENTNNWYRDLKAYIDRHIKPNNKKEITGYQMNTVLNGIVDATFANLAEKMDVPSESPTEGNFASFDSEGRVLDSGHKNSDYATSAQGAKADTAVQEVAVSPNTVTGNPGTNAVVENIGSRTTPVLKFTIPRGQDAYNPFKGTYLSTDTLPSTGNAGDYIYVVFVDTSTTPDTVTIKVYTWNGTAFADSGATVDLGNAQFSTGEYVSSIGIEDAPQLDSDNLVKSGGVMQSILDIMSSGTNIALTTIGYYDENKTVSSLSTWKCGEISLGDCSAIAVDVECDGANAYCYLLDSSNSVLKMWNNTMVQAVVTKTEYPTASKLLLSCRSEYDSSVVKYLGVDDTRNELEGAIDNTRNEVNAHVGNVCGSVYGTSWKLNSDMEFNLDGAIVGNGVPSDNTAISFYTGNRNVWWIKAHLHNNGEDFINAGLVLAENTLGKSFRLLKTSFHKTSNPTSITIIDFHSHPMSSFIETQRLLSSTSTDYKGDDCTLAMCISGSTVAGYLNGAFLGSKQFSRINGGSRTMFGGVLMSLDNKAYDFSFGERPTPYCHFSLDDVGVAMRAISNDGNLESIFDNEMFAFLKEMHDSYGLCVTLNLFYSIDVDGITWTLASFPDTFKSEFQANSSWLKFAFHGGDESIKYDSTDNNSAALTAYANTMTQIARFAGEASIDYMPRLTYFSGNKTLLNALRDTGMFWGCLTRDNDTANSSNYSLTTAERDCINKSSDYVDFANSLYYVRSAPRFDTQTTAQAVANVMSDINDNGRNRVFEYFTHAVNTISNKDRVSIEEMCKIMVKNHVRFDFAMNNMPF